MTRTLVLTVTPNPSLDLLFDADTLVWDDANRLPDPRRRPGGQGINVTRAVRALGGRSAAVALLAGRTGAEIRAVLESEGTPLDAVEAAAPAGDTRTFVAVRERTGGRSMLLNARGPERSAEDAAALEAATARAIDTLAPVWLACCGSLPPGFPADFYARLARLGRRMGCRVVTDCDGEALRQAVEAGCDLLVPNQHEAGRLTGHAVHDLDDACEAALSLTRMGASLASVTLGAHGAALAAAGDCWRAAPPPLRSGSAVGAGDAFLAGLLVALDGYDGRVDHGYVLARAVAAGSAVLLSAGSVLLDAADCAAVLGRVRV